MRRALPLLVLLIACGGKVGPSSGIPYGDDTPTAVPTATGTERGPVPPPTPTPVPTGPLPPKPANATYTARAWLGGLDHVDIYKADYGRDLCVHLHLTSPSSQSPDAPFASIITPEGWAVQTGDRSKGASACTPDDQRATRQMADFGKGLVRWTPVPGQLLPCTLDVHAAISFDDTKAAEQLDADGISVQGCQ